MLLLAVLLAPGMPAARATCGPVWGGIAAPTSSDPYVWARAMDGLSTTDAWIAGGSSTSPEGGGTPFVARKNGASWSTTAFPAQGDGTNELNGLVEFSPTDTWIVGDYAQGIYHYPIAANWNGAVWTQKPPPTLGKTTWASDVDGRSGSDLWVAASYDTANGTRWPLVFHRTTKWKVEDLPTLKNATLEDVDWISDRNVWAVGRIFSGGKNHTLVVHYDGHTWTRVPSVDPKRGAAQLNEMVAVSSKFVIAVGNNDVGSKTLPLLERWSPAKGKWIMMPRDQLPGLSYLTGVDALSAKDAWAVGWGINAGVSMHWDGTSWKVEPVAPSGTSSSVQSVTMFPGMTWAAGGYATATNGYVLLEQYCS